MYLRKMEISVANDKHFTKLRGDKTYELSNHLGNVLATVTDRKLGVSFANSNTIAQYYQAEVSSATDYYPFGSQMPGRNVQSLEAKYGFNGKEKDPEGMGGGGTTYDYGFRIYNPQIGKFLSVDPLTKSYPWYTPYQFAGNRSIEAIDLDGLEEYFVVRWYDNNQLQETTVLKVPNRIQVANNLGDGTIYVELNNDAQGRAAYLAIFGGAQGSTANTENRTNFSSILDGNGNILLGTYQNPDASDVNGLRPYERDIVNRFLSIGNPIRAKDDIGSNDMAISAKIPSLNPITVTFPNDVSVLTAANQNTLTPAKRTLESYPSLTATIRGSTDSEHDNGYNQRLGLRRATSVSNFITGPQLNGTISPVNVNRLTLVSIGERFAKQSGATVKQKEDDRSATIRINYPQIGR